MYGLLKAQFSLSMRKKGSNRISTIILEADCLRVVSFPLMTLAGIGVGCIGVGTAGARGA